MTWQVYHLVFRLETPLHIGRRGWGIIQRTRPYLMGKNLWAAATARLTQLLDSTDYEAVGNALKQRVIFTYHYPAIVPQTPLLPHYRAGEGLYYGDLSAADFEYRFIGSYAATAIDPTAQAAEEASLHEIEVLLPHPRDAETPVYLCGYMLLREGATILGQALTIENLAPLLRDVQVGGERGYGYGRLLLCQDKPELVATALFGRYDLVDKSGAAPTLGISSGLPLPAHTLLRDVQAAGDIEPLTGREWGFEKREEPEKPEGAGQKIPQGKEVPVCYVPGSVLADKHIFHIRPELYGVLDLQAIASS